MEQTAVHKGRRPRTRSLDTRAAILAAAEEVFAKAGLDGARIDAIAAAAGVNKALLYYYFKSKDGLYEAVIDDQFREFNRQALAVLEAPEPGRRSSSSATSACTSTSSAPAAATPRSISS